MPRESQLVLLSRTLGGAILALGLAAFSAPALAAYATGGGPIIIPTPTVTLNHSHIDGSVPLGPLGDSELVPPSGEGEFSYGGGDDRPRSEPFPEPASLLLLALGGTLIRRRR